MRRLALSLLLATVVFAAVDGTVLNRTTGKPQPEATVTLISMGQGGMERLGSVASDAQGRFSLNLEPGQAHMLIEAAFGGVTYNRVIPPGGPYTNLELEVYDSSSKPGSARVVQRIVFLEPGAGQLSVNEAWLFQNDGKLTYNDPEGGTLKFFLPEAAGGNVSVMATAPQGMPLQRSAEKTSRANVYKVDFPIKPGDTRIDLSYVLPEPGTFSSKTLYAGTPTRLVAPAGVTLTGEGLAALGQDPTLRASVYEIKDQNEFAVQLAGTGSLRANETAEDAGPSIDQILPRVYDNLPWIIAPVLAILALGFVLLYRTSPRPQAAAPKRRG